MRFVEEKEEMKFFFVSFSQRPAKRNNLYKLNLIGAVKFFEGRGREKKEIKMAGREGLWDLNSVFFSE